MFKNDRQAAFAMIAQFSKEIIINAQSTMQDVKKVAQEKGKAFAAKECAKAGIPCEVAKSWLL